MKVINCYFCTNLQQLSNCWPAIALRIQVTVMLLTERYTLIRNFTMMTSVILESINHCNFTLACGMIVYFHAYDISFLKIEFLTSRLRTSCFDFIFVDCSLSRPRRNWRQVIYKVWCCVVFWAKATVLWLDPCRL